jgi:hypothetical protein
VLHTTGCASVVGEGQYQQSISSLSKGLRVVSGGLKTPKEQVDAVRRIMALLKQARAHFGRKLDQSFEASPPFVFALCFIHSPSRPPAPQAQAVPCPRSQECLVDAKYAIINLLNPDGSLDHEAPKDDLNKRYSAVIMLLLFLLKKRWPSKAKAAKWIRRIANLTSQEHIDAHHPVVQARKVRTQGPRTRTSSLMHTTGKGLMFCDAVSSCPNRRSPPSGGARS